MSDQDPRLIDRLRRFDRSTVVPPHDPQAEAKLLGAFDAARMDAEGRAKALRHLPWLRSRRASRGRWLAIAAVIALAAGVAVWMRANQVPAGAPAPSAAMVEPTDFVLWPGASALPPFESGHLVRMDLPASMLPSLGLFPPASDAASVRADVLIGQDGLARAVRLLPSDHHSEGSP